MKGAVNTQKIAAKNRSANSSIGLLIHSKPKITNVHRVMYMQALQKDPGEIKHTHSHAAIITSTKKNALR